MVTFPSGIEIIMRLRKQGEAAPIGIALQDDEMVPPVRGRPMRDLPV